MNALIAILEYNISFRFKLSRFFVKAHVIGIKRQQIVVDPYFQMLIVAFESFVQNDISSFRPLAKLNRYVEG